MKYTLNRNCLHRVCILLHIWRIKILSNYRPVCNKTQYTTENFLSYRPDPNCIAVNAFLINCEKEKFYVFPPFAYLSKTLQKIYQDKAKGILIGPDWPSQPFYPRLIEMSSPIISFPPRKRNLYLPSQPSLLHPSHRKLSLLACLVDGETIQ